MNRIGCGRGIGGCLRHALQGENFIRHVGNDKLIFDFHEGNGITCHDLSHNNNDGTLTNPTDLTWKRNELQFGGTNGHIVVADDDTLDFGTANFTIIMMLKQRVEDTETVITKNTQVGESPAGEKKWQLHMKTSGYYFAANAVVVTNNDTSYDDQCFHSMILKRVGNDANWNIDGKPDGVGVGVFSGLSFSNNINLYIGARITADICFNGFMKIVRILNKGLSGIECQQEYLANKFSNN